MCYSNTEIVYREKTQLMITSTNEAYIGKHATQRRALRMVNSTYDSRSQTLPKTRGNPLGDMKKGLEMPGSHPLLSRTKALLPLLF